MRGVLYAKKFSPDIRPVWYLAALAGLLLFCLAPFVPPRNVPTEHEAVTAVTDADWNGIPADESVRSVFLTLGDRGEWVLQLQRQLSSLGYDVGGCSGVYGTKTASAVRRFQLDCGFVGDGVCSAEVASAAAFLSDAAALPVSENAVWDALAAVGCLDPIDGDGTDDLLRDGRMRNALILFQRTHGLCGSGNADYATLCALGVVTGSSLLSSAYDGLSAREAAEAAGFDLRCRLLGQALAAFVDRYPQAYDLYTLTACASVLCARTEDSRFPGGFDTVCRIGLLPSDSVEMPVNARSPMADDRLILCAAEDALRAFLSDDGSASGHGALYVQPAEEALPEDADVCFYTRHFVFFR